MDKTEIKMPRSLASRDAVQFIQDKLNEYDLSRLSEIKFEHKDYDDRHPVPHTWGNTRHPNPFAKRHKTKHTFRMSTMVRGRDEDCGWKYEDFPRVRKAAKKYGFFYHDSQRYDNLSELMVHIVGHEMYHYLCWTKQIPFDHRDERRAEKHGDDWVHLYREWSKNV